MSNQRDPVAKRLESGEIEYTCPICGGWDRLCEVYHAFLPFVDHLIRDLCVSHHPMLKEPRLVGSELWYQVPGTSKLIPGLPPYNPDSAEWKELLGEGRKILPQAEILLPDIGDWLEMALSTLEDLNALRKSDILTAEKLISLAGSLREEFEEQKIYLLEHKAHLEQTGTDPKWLAKPGNQARFVAHSMAGARWNLTTSSSREMIRKVDLGKRREALESLNIVQFRDWWKPKEMENNED